jgi:hypothetical protein
MARARIVALYALILFSSTGWLHAQDSGAYTRKNSFGVFGEYSNDSSHILLGSAEQRKLLDFGLTYSRLLITNRVVDFQYLLEITPVMLESDPLAHDFLTATTTYPSGPPLVQNFPEQTGAVTACRPLVLNSTFHYMDNQGQPVTVQETETQTCSGRQWTFGEGLSPVGLKLNFRTHHRWQPVFTGLGGYLFTTQPIPIAQAGSFNFTFSLGAGVEFYRSREKSKSWFGNRSIRAEYRYHHISNHNTADYNPGIDNGLFQVTYAFGK